MRSTLIITIALLILCEAASIYIYLDSEIYFSMVLISGLCLNSIGASINNFTPSNRWKEFNIAYAVAVLTIGVVEVFLPIILGFYEGFKLGLTAP